MDLDANVTACGIIAVSSAEDLHRSSLMRNYKEEFDDN